MFLNKYRLRNEKKSLKMCKVWAESWRLFINISPGIAVKPPDEGLMGRGGPSMQYNAMKSSLIYCVTVLNLKFEFQWIYEVVWFYPMFLCAK